MPNRPTAQPIDAPLVTPRSTIPGNLWPTIPSGTGARMQGVLAQLETTQWLDPEALRELQFRQLGQLLAHAYRGIPFYRDRLAAAGYAPDEAVSPEIWARIPHLTREDIQREGESLRSPALPPHHGKVHAVTTSGSTGKPIKTYGTTVTRFFWNVFTVREHLWHRRDLTGKLSAIRMVKGTDAAYPDGVALPNWGPATAMLFDTGPATLLSIRSTIKQQADWLRRQDPDYLITFPSNLIGLAAYCRDNGVKLAKLREVRTLAEILHPEARDLCREVWGVKVADMYSSQEAGYLALQCPEHEHYHAQAEGALVEILDDEGRPCGPGEVGRVVVTPLHNFAMPLIRYDQGDYAEVGGACDCGRGLPVLKQIVGRVRNLLMLPSGERFWPSLRISKIGELFPVRQCQFVQKSLDTIEVRLVPLRELTGEEEDKLRTTIQDHLGHPFELVFTYHDEIPRGAGGKFEDFKSEIAG